MLNILKKTILLSHRYRHRLQLDMDFGFGLLNLRRRKWLNYRKFAPNLVMVGGQKCGTTSLAGYLKYHPEIHVSAPLKEPGYLMWSSFIRDYWRDMGHSYANRNELLSKGMLENYSWQRYFCDASTYYTMSDNDSTYGISLGLRKDTKILYLVRNPFDRLQSAFRHLRRTSAVTFEQFLEQPEPLLTSKYFTQIKPFVDQLGHENVHLIISEQFFDDPQATLDAVCSFLEIDCFTPATGFPVLNASQDKSDQLFTSEQYQRLFKVFESDVRDLEDLFSVETKWDLSESRWIKARTSKDESQPF